MAQILKCPRGYDLSSYGKSFRFIYNIMIRYFQKSEQRVPRIFFIFFQEVYFCAVSGLGMAHTQNINIGLAVKTIQ